MEILSGSLLRLNPGLIISPELVRPFGIVSRGRKVLVKGKKVYIAMSSGAVYSDGLYQPYDFVSPYLRTMLGFLGMTDLTIIRIEGVNIPGLKETALERAIESLRL